MPKTPSGEKPRRGPAVRRTKRGPSRTDLKREGILERHEVNHRPTLYSDELGQMIFEHMCLGKSVAQIAEEFEINKGNVIAWGTDPQHPFSALYERGKRARAEAAADGMLQKVEKSSLYELQRTRLWCEVQKWYASRAHSKAWGDKVTQEIKDERPREVHLVWDDGTPMDGVEHGDAGPARDSDAKANASATPNRSE